MIIDSGHDLYWIAGHYLLDGDELKVGPLPLVAIALSGDLDYLFTEVVRPDFDGDLSACHDDILEAVDEDDVRYFAVAHRSTTARPESIDLESHRALEKAGHERGLHLIGELHFDDIGWSSSGPMCAFAHYRDDDLPRVVVRRPRQYAQDRCRGGKERERPDGTLPERFRDERVSVREAGGA